MDYSELNPLPHHNFSDKSKFKVLADDKINVTEKSDFLGGSVENVFVKRRKRWLPAFFFLFLPQGR